MVFLDFSPCLNANFLFEKSNIAIAFFTRKWYNKLEFIPRGIFMAANYNKLWKLLIDKGMTKTDLRMKTGMSTSTLAKMSKNENVSLDVILSICKVLECNIGDVVDATEKED